MLQFVTRKTLPSLLLNCWGARHRNLLSFEDKLKTTLHNYYHQWLKLWTLFWLLRLSAREEPSALFLFHSAPHWQVNASHFCSSIAITTVKPTCSNILLESHYLEGTKTLQCPSQNFLFISTWWCTERYSKKWRYSICCRHTAVLFSCFLFFKSITHMNCVIINISLLRTG